MTTPLWPQVLKQLEAVLNEQQMQTWISPLEAMEDARRIRLVAPSGFILDWVNKKLFGEIKQAVGLVAPVNPPEVTLEVGDYALDSFDEPEVSSVPQALRETPETKQDVEPAAQAKSTQGDSGTKNPSSTTSTPISPSTLRGR